MKGHSGLYKEIVGGMTGIALFALSPYSADAITVLKKNYGQLNKAGISLEEFNRELKKGRIALPKNMFSYPVSLKEGDSVDDLVDKLSNSLKANLGNEYPEDEELAKKDLLDDLVMHNKRHGIELPVGKVRKGEEYTALIFCPPQYLNKRIERDYRKIEELEELIGRYKADFESLKGFATSEIKELKEEIISLRAYDILQDREINALSEKVSGLEERLYKKQIPQAQPPVISLPAIPPSNIQAPPEEECKEQRLNSYYPSNLLENRIKKNPELISDLIKANKFYILESGSNALAIYAKNEGTKNGGKEKFDWCGMGCGIREVPMEEAMKIFRGQELSDVIIIGDVGYPSNFMTWQENITDRQEDIQGILLSFKDYIRQLTLYPIDEECNHKFSIPVEEIIRHPGNGGQTAPSCPSGGGGGATGQLWSVPKEAEWAKFLMDPEYKRNFEDKYLRDSEREMLHGKARKDEVFHKGG